MPSVSVRWPPPRGLPVFCGSAGTISKRRNAKVDKDLFQDSVLVAVLGDRYPGALESAMRALPLSTHSQLTLAATRIWPALDAHPRAQEEFRAALAATQVVWTEPAGG